MYLAIYFIVGCLVWLVDYKAGYQTSEGPLWLGELPIWIAAWPLRIIAIAFNTYGCIAGEFYAESDKTALKLATSIFGDKLLEKGRSIRQVRENTMSARIEHEIKHLMDK